MLLLRCCVHAAYVERKKAKEVSSKKAPYTNQQTDGMNKIVIDIFACETAAAVHIENNKNNNNNALSHKLML